MDEIILKDDAKKEAKFIFIVMIICALIGIVHSLLFYFKPTSDTPLKDAVIIFLLYTLLCGFGFFCCIWNVCYKIEVYREKIIIKWIYGEKSILLSDIKNYKCRKRINVDVYIFTFFINDKKIKIYTHFKKEFEEILKTVIS